MNPDAAPDGRCCDAFDPYARNDYMINGARLPDDFEDLARTRRLARASASTAAARSAQPELAPRARPPTAFSWYVPLPPRDTVAAHTHTVSCVMLGVMRTECARLCLPQVILPDHQPRLLRHGTQPHRDARRHGSR